MGVIEFELERIVHAPIDDVFTRLADIEGHNKWMPGRGSIFKHTEQTSPGPPAKGTTYLDQTSVGPTPGEISEFERPTTLVYHWWDKSKGGKLKAEGWPGYSLEAKGDHTTLVRHHARIETQGAYRLATPIFRWMALRERTATIEALQASFGHLDDEDS
ncbi:hypothetical protein ACOCJ7_02870 [Knoellia sp. CPCC 206453]|uniref:hypothetical protein n=1 Tax=Knoellia pratensis TaxID=3404796 RepID=UPI0036217299